jgi:hypothetical protein
MDATAEPVLISLAGCPPQPRQDTKTGVMFVTEYPRLAQPTEIPSRVPFRSGAANDLEVPRRFEKDVNLEGTNSTSPVESAKVSKNELKTNSKQRRKTCLLWAKKAKQSTSGTPIRRTPNRHYGFAFPCHRGASYFKIERTNHECL